MRFISALISFFGVFLLVVVLSSAGFTRPKALMGAILVTTYFGFHAAKEFAFEKKKKSSEFVVEEKRVRGLLEKNFDIEPALATLIPSYRIVGDATGFTLSGPCRVVDLSGAIVDIRVEVRKSKVERASCTPKLDGSLSEVVATLNRKSPPEAVDRTPRDWMGHPLDRK